MTRKRKYKPKKHLRRKRGVVILRLPRYTEEEIEEFEREIRELIEAGKAKFKPVNEFPEFKDVKFVSVYVGDKTHVKAEYHKVKGRKVYIKPYPKRANKENNPDFRP